MQQCHVCQIQPREDNIIRLEMLMPFRGENLKAAAQVMHITFIGAILGTLIKNLSHQKNSLTSCSSANSRGLGDNSKDIIIDSSSKERNAGMLVKKKTQTWAFYSDKCFPCYSSCLSLSFQACYRVDLYKMALTTTIAYNVRITTSSNWLAIV